MQHATEEHTGLLRMGLEVDSSLLFWQNAEAGESPKERRDRATTEGWFPRLSQARLKYLLTELEKRFPLSARLALRSWRPENDEQAHLVCHWHMQCSDPLYRDFTSGFLVGAWARADQRIGVCDVEQWLERRGTHAEWSTSTRRRLASGLLAAASDAGFLKGSGRQRELRTVTVNPASLDYLKTVLLGGADSQPLGEEILLSGTVPET